MLFEFADATRLASSIGFSTNSFKNRGCYGAHVPNMLFLLFLELSQGATARATAWATGKGHWQGRWARATAMGKSNGQVQWARAMDEGYGKGLRARAMCEVDG